MGTKTAKKAKSNYAAVLISDVHYNLTTLPLADNAMRQAINKANALKIPLIVAGDLHDSKALLRAECVSALIETFNTIETPTFIIRGNHDAHHEKSTETSIKFLDGINCLTMVNDEMLVYGDFTLIPYYHDPDKLREVLKHIPPGGIVIMHQGIQGSDSGEYIQDKSAISPEDVSHLRVISGHYHKRQDIKTGKYEFSYIGNPYTLSFAEAHDPAKGYRLLKEDGTLEFIPTNLRKHIVYESTVDELGNAPKVSIDDLVRIRVKGTKAELSALTRSRVSELTGINTFKLEQVVLDAIEYTPEQKNLRPEELFDSIIDSTASTRKDYLKTLWRKLA